MSSSISWPNALTRARRSKSSPTNEFTFPPPSEKRLAEFPLRVAVGLRRPAGDRAVLLAEPVGIVLEAGVELQMGGRDDRAGRELQRQVCAGRGMAGTGLPGPRRINCGERV